MVRKRLGNTLIPSKSEASESVFPCIFCFLPSFSSLLFNSFLSPFTHTLSSFLGFFSSFSSSPENLLLHHHKPLELTMENLTLSSSSSSSSSHISAAGFDDYSEDCCSICLEPFGINDPSTITSCKHEYHLQCILEWSQRSSECPICLQSLSLVDPSSQELLAAMETEKRSRSRNMYPSSSANSRFPLERVNVDYDDSCSDDSDIDDHIMQHLAAATSRSRFVHRRERMRSSGAGPSEVPVFNSPVYVSRVQPTLTTSPSGGSSPISVGEAARNATLENDFPFKTRVLYTQPPSPSESGRRLNTSEMFSIPESIKSKFSAASARYKESISKSTRGLKEKLLAHNASVKELSKGVQREMNAGIAGVARMIERLELTSKRPGSPLIPVSPEGSSGFPAKGKSVEENSIEHSPIENVVQDVTPDTPSLISSMVAGRVEIRPHVQSEHDAVRT